MLRKEDYKVINEAAKEGGDLWKNPRVFNIKNKIKENLRASQDEQCCYCRRNTDGEFKMVLDIEHILPRSKFKNLMFSPLNLSVSCKRCNMNIKRDDISFVVDVNVIKTSPFLSKNYKFIHPNLDSYFNHLKYYALTINNNKIIKYNSQTKKGEFHYDYFKLYQLEVKSCNSIQGMVSNFLNETISSDIAEKIDHLLKDSENEKQF
jgi:uncharacterized protein (TIGR02646 family)